MKTVTKETITEYDENGRVTRVTTTETTEESVDKCQNCWRYRPWWQVDTTPINTTPSITWMCNDCINTAGSIGTTTITY